MTNTDSHAASVAEKLARKQTAIEGKPFGMGSHSEYEGKTMTGAQAIIASLECEGVDTIFGYPGGQAIKIYDALYDSKRIHHVLARHEQGATHMADGYARATGKVGVVLVTSGPGATNTVTGIMTAYMDSVPLVVITGQVTRGVIGTDSFQESDIVGITMPIVKHSFLLQSTDDLTRTFREAFYIASTGRPGPVLIDIPSDLSGAQMVFHYPDSISIASYKPTYRGNARQVKQAAQLIMKAKRPLIYAGGGIVTSHACQELVELSETMDIPVVTSLMGKGAMPCSNKHNLGPVGMHGSKYANMAVMECDLLIAVGARFSDRVTGKVSEFAPHAKVIHIDIDPAEIGKIVNPTVPIVGDAKVVLASLNERLHKEDAKPVDDGWFAEVCSWRERWPFYTDDFASSVDYPDKIAPEVVLSMLSDKLDPDASIVTTEVGQHQMWAHQNIRREHARTFLSSGGAGTMHGLWLPRRHWRQDRLPRRRGGLHCRRRLVPDERAGDGHRRPRGRSRQGDDHRQQRPGNGLPVAEALLPRALLVHQAARRAGLCEAGRRLRLARPAHLSPRGGRGRAGRDARLQGAVPPGRGDSHGPDGLPHGGPGCAHRRHHRCAGRDAWRRARLGQGLWQGRTPRHSGRREGR